MGDASSQSTAMERRSDELITIYRNGLLKDVLPFWTRHSVDREHGGFMMSVDRDGRLSVLLKGNLWKGPFRLPRMQLKCWRLVDQTIQRQT